jgi:hypothetical protein
MNRQIHFRTGGEQLAEIQRRQPVDAKENYSAVIREQLDRYFALLEVGRKRAGCLFTRDEVALIAHVLNGIIIDQTWIGRPLLAWEIKDALAERDRTEGGVDDLALVTKLEVLDPAVSLALIDAIERYWANPQRGDPRNILKEEE